MINRSIQPLEKEDAASIDRCGMTESSFIPWSFCYIYLGVGVLLRVLYIAYTDS